MFRCLLPVLLLLTAASGAWAQFEASGELIGYDQECPVSFARVHLRNRTGEKALCEVRFAGGSGFYGQVNLAPVEIEPDGERVIDIPVPLMPYSFLHVTANGRRIQVALSRPSVHGLMFLNVAEMEKWGSEKELDEFSRQWNDPGTHYGSYSSPGSGSAYRVVTQLEPDRLPENWLCYAPYRGVFCRESAYDRLPAGARGALMKWVDSGGHLTVYGSEKNETIRQMAGTIQFQSRNPLTYSAREMTSEWRRARPAWQGNSSQWGHLTGPAADDKSFPFGVKEGGGKAGAFGLATVFLIVAGPVNYFYFRRRGQIRRLMVSLPVISIAFCVLIMIYFVATQGFTRRGGSFAVTLLDEARGGALTFTRHSVYSGLYPLGGFKFGRETGFVPLRKVENFSITLGPKLHLESGIFQPTSNFHYQTIHPHTTREKLLHDPEEQTVANGFEKRIETVVLCDGDSWYVARDIDPGAKARLERIPQELVAGASGENWEKLTNVFAGQLARWDQKERDFLLVSMSSHLRAPLPEGTRYMISFTEADPEIIQPGLDRDDPGVRHVLMSTAVRTETSFAPPPSPTAETGGTNAAI